MGGNHGVLPTPVNTAIKTATSGGTVVGMLLFGWLADRLGRKENVWSGIGNHRARDIGTIPVCPKFRYHANGFIDILESNNGDRYWWRLPIVGSHYFRVSYFLTSESCVADGSCRNTPSHALVTRQRKTSIDPNNTDLL